MKKYNYINNKIYYGLIILLLICGLNIISCSNNTPERPETIEIGDYSYAIKYIEHQIESLLKENKMPGASVSLINDQEIIWDKNFGYINIEEQIQHRDDTIFKVGGFSTIITNLAILKLYEEGKLDIDDPITEYIPNFSIKSRYKNIDPITIRSIMIGRSGLPNSLDIEIPGLPEKEKSLEDIVNSLKNLFVSYPPNYRFKPSLVATNILGRIIEIISNENFPEYMKNNILNPIGMNHSSFISDREIKLNLANSYASIEDEPIRQFDSNNMPSDGLYSTLNDINKFIKFIFNEGKINNEQFISKEILNLMFEDNYSNPRDPQKYGFGWYIFDHPTLRDKKLFVSPIHFSHFATGFSNVIAIMPDEKLGFAVLLNGGSIATYYTTLANDILEHLLEAKIGSIIDNSNDAETDDIEDFINIDKAKLQKYAGHYVIGGAPVEVREHRGNLRINIMGTNINLTTINENTFKLSHFMLALSNIDYMLLKFFVNDDILEDCVVIIEDSNMYIVGPKYEIPDEIPNFWKELEGNYTIRDANSNNVLGKGNIQINNGVLRLKIDIDGLKYFSMPLALNPINNNEFIIMGGVPGLFDGETITYDESSKSFRFYRFLISKN